MPSSSLLNCAIALKLNHPVTGMEITAAIQKVVPAKDLFSDPSDSYIVLGQINREPIWDIIVVAGDCNEELEVQGNTGAFIKPFIKYKAVGLKNFFFGGIRYSMNYAEPEAMFLTKLLELKKALEAELNK